MAKTPFEIIQKLDERERCNHMHVFSMDECNSRKLYNEVWIETGILGAPSASHTPAPSAATDA